LSGGFYPPTVLSEYINFNPKIAEIIQKKLTFIYLFRILSNIKDERADECLMQRGFDERTETG
jgi:hypothetical protein